MKNRLWAVLRHPAARFAAASLSPAVLLLLAATLGGVWALAAFLWMTVFLFFADRLARRLGLVQPQTGEDVWTCRLAAGLGALHFPLLLYSVFALSGGTGLGPMAWIFCFLGFGLWFGQVSNSCAHELIHRSDRARVWLGTWIYISLLYGQHASAHRLVHHQFVATADDPNTAQVGEGFYDFLMRAWPGEFQAGYEMESARHAARAGRGLALHPYTIHLGGAALCLLVMGEAFGFAGLIVYLLIAAYAQLQLLLSDYVQHYGLERRRIGLDGHESVGPEHSWDAPDFVSGLMMLHAPRHADHHLHPARAYPDLALSPGGRAPLLPYSLPVMASLALVPPLWRRLMDRRVAGLGRMGPGE